MHWKQRLSIARESILALIPLYRATKNPYVLQNIQRMLQLRRDIMYYEFEVKTGKTIVRSTEPYDQGYPQPNCKKIYELTKIHKPKIDEIALYLLRKNNTSSIWYGNPELCQAIHREYKSHNTSNHPLNQIAAVLSALSRSKLFTKTGYINHLGRKYPVFEPVQ